MTKTTKLTLTACAAALLALAPTLRAATDAAECDHEHAGNAACGMEPAGGGGCCGGGDQTTAEKPAEGHRMRKYYRGGKIIWR